MFNGSLSGLGPSISCSAGLIPAGQPGPGQRPRAAHSRYARRHQIRMTVNLGLRHELPFPPVAINNAMINTGPERNAGLRERAPGMLFYGDPAFPFRPADEQAVAPRVGLRTA
jgi:hypothetical protein